MRSTASAILGAPIASWALYGCLTLGGMPWQSAGTIALAWGALWLSLAQLGHVPRWMTRNPRAQRRSSRGRWLDAVLATLFLPLPVFLLALVIQWMQLAPASVTLTLLAMLGAPVPATFWWVALRPAVRREETLAFVLSHHTPVGRVAMGAIPSRGAR